MVTALLLTCLIPAQAFAPSAQTAFDKTAAVYQKRADLEPNNPERWYDLATLYLEKVQKDRALSRAAARKYVLQGLEFTSRALMFNAKYYEALDLKDALLRQQAGYETDAAVRKKLIAEADTFKATAAKIREHP